MIDSSISHYRIISKLGGGGMGVVYKAEDIRLHRFVALKFLPESVAGDAPSRARFEREARTISSLSHPNICTLYDIGQQDGSDYLVMEFLEGGTLADELARGRLSVPQALRIAREIASALDRAHRAGVVHRDLKPGNIMLTKTGAKLLDFGLAKPAATAITDNALTALTQSRPLTAEGAIVGTFQYMAPEQVEGREADARTDIFAVGAVLYEMIPGQRAFDGRTQASVIASVLASEPKPMNTLQPLVPPALERLVRACLGKDPDERWQTAHDLKLQIDAIEELGSQAGVPAPVRERRNYRRTLLWPLAAVVFLACAVAGWVWHRPQTPSPLRAVLLPPNGSSFDAQQFCRLA